MKINFFLLSLLAVAVTSSALAASFKIRDKTNGSPLQDTDTFLIQRNDVGPYFKINASQMVSYFLGTGQPLSKTDDTNVTLTLSGSPSTALLNPTSIAVGWTGQLAIARGGTGGNDAATARDNLGLEIGADVQAYNSTLDSIATNGKFLGASDNASAPAHSWSGDPDTGMFNAGTNSIGFSVGGNGQAYFDSSGRLLIGSSSAWTTRTGTGGTTSITPRSQIQSTGPDASFMISRFSNDSSGPFLAMTKSRGTSLATAGTTSDGDTLGTISFAGSGSTLGGEAARIIGMQDGANTNDGRSPGKLLFYTSDGASVVTEKMVIKTDGKIGINTSSPSARLHIISTAEPLRVGYNTSNYFSTSVGSTGDATLNLTGTSPEFTFSDPVNVPDEAYDSGWNGNTEVPTKNAVYDKIQLLRNEYCVALSDYTTDLTTGTAKGTLYLPAAATVTGVRAFVNTAPTGSTLIMDINEAGSTILSTRVNLDASEKTSGTAATPPVISDSSIAANAEITFDIDQVGSSTKGKGLVGCIEVTF